MSANCYRQRPNLSKLTTQTYTSNLPSYKSTAQHVNNSIETYSVNLNNITIYLYKIDTEDKEVPNSTQLSPKQTQQWKDILQLWANSKKNFKLYAKTKAKTKINNFKLTNRLFTQPLALQSCKSSNRSFGVTKQQAESVHEELLLPMYAKSVRMNTNRRNLIQRKQKMQGALRNNYNDGCNNKINEKSTNKAVCFSSLGSNTRRQMKGLTKPMRFKTEHNQKEKISCGSSTLATPITYKKNKKVDIFQTIQVEKNINRQRRMSIRTLDLNDQT